MTILVTGATGSIGRHVVDMLVAAARQVRVLTRDPDRAVVPDGVEVVRGDLTRPDTLQDALRGVERIHLFPVTEGVRDLVDAAGKAGVRRIVALSGGSAAGRNERERSSWTHRQYRTVESAVEAGDMEWTFVRPGPLAKNLLWWAPSIRAEDVVRAPFARAAQAPVHEADVAAVASAALLEDGHVGAKYFVTGPETLTHAEQAHTIGRAVGREVRFEELAPDRWRESVTRFLPPQMTEELLQYWSETATAPDVALPTVEQVTGRPGRTLERWAAEHAASFR